MKSSLQKDLRKIGVSGNSFTESEIVDKLLKAFGMTVSDLPAFPKKEINWIDFILAAGIEKIKQKTPPFKLGGV